MRFGAVLERGPAKGKSFAGVALALAACISSVPATAQSQMELNEQASQAFGKADGALNKVYGQLLAKVSPVGKEALKQAQRSWLTFRDQECDFETMGTLGGSIHGMMVVECRARLTLARVKDLQAQVSCSEGDLSCGGQ